MTRPSIARACALAAAGLLVAAPARGQDETGSRRTADSAGSAAGAPAPTARPLGAAPVPAERGPLGEPAPSAGSDPDGPDERGTLPVGPIADATGAAPALGASGAARGETRTSEEDASEGGLLGSPAPTPGRHSLLPPARTAARPAAAVPVLGPAWGLVGDAFREDQLTHPRVVEAQLNAKFELKALFAARGLSWPPRDLYFRLLKQEQVLEVWVREAQGAETFALLREYDICAIPGRLGPKTRVDDFQAPEGFYYIQGFNPESDFHLSLRLNYPNAADRIIGVADSWGGDIYIHGGCSTVGCFPMTDEAMQELYWLAVEARTAGQDIIPVHVFPARMDEDGMRWLRNVFGRDEQLIEFWDNLREGYDFFERHRRLPAISVDARGRYVFAEAAADADDAAAEPAAPAPIEGLLGSEASTTSDPVPEQPSSDDAEPIQPSPLSGLRTAAFGDPPTTLLP